MRRDGDGGAVTIQSFVRRPVSYIYIDICIIHNSNTKMRVEKNFILNSENIYPIQINRSDNGNVMWFGRISYYTFLCDYPHLSTHP